jgi:hypothetical protein
LNRRDLPTLLADLDDLCLRAKDAGVTPALLHTLGQARDQLWLLSQLPERESVPPLLEANQPARTAATIAFRAARKILADLK